MRMILFSMWKTYTERSVSRRRHIQRHAYVYVYESQYRRNVATYVVGRIDQTHSTKTGEPFGYCTRETQLPI